MFQTGIADMNSALMSPVLDDNRLNEIRDQTDRIRAAIQQMETLVCLFCRLTSSAEVDDIAPYRKFPHI